MKYDYVSGIIWKVKTCLGCQLLKPEADFNFKNKLKQKRQAQCKFCTRLAIQKHYYNNRNYYIKKAKEKNLKEMLRVRQFIHGYLNTHQCVDCGENDILVLEFDHRGDKFMNVSSMVANKFALSKIVEEMNKCDIRCANCHRRKTALQQGWSKINFAPIA